MGRYVFLALFVACLPLQALCLQRSTPPLLPAFPGGVRTVADLPYRTIGDETLVLDLYLPPSRHDVRPAIVFVHGGGFVTGHTRMMGAATDFPARLAALAARGYVVASIQYRLAPRAHFPAQVRDAKAAIAWLREHAGKYGIDPTRIAIWGSSAGGTIAATVGTTCGIAMFEPEGSALPPDKTCVQAVADWFGPVTMDGQMLGATYLGCVTGEPCNERRRSASPASYVKKGAPPFLLLHGDNDKLVPVDQSRQFAAVLRAAGVETNLQIVAGAEHGLKATDPARQQSILDQAMDRLASFLEQTIGPSSRRNDKPATGRK
jgi:acetyl esterase/lipase